MTTTSSQHIKEHVHLSWTRVEKERVPTLRDREGRMLYPFNEYLDELSASLAKRHVLPQAVKSSMDPATYALKSFAAFLEKTSSNTTDVDDELLVRFRDEALENVKRNPAHRGHDNKAKKTVNIKLRQIYQFLYRCQKAHRLPANTIGWSGCKVRSTLPLADVQPSPNANGLDRRLHPLCFQSIGEGSRDDNSQYWATTHDIEELEEVFWRLKDPYLSHRNTLMLRVGERMSWRVSSINSLEIRQFSAEALAAQNQLDTFAVVPPFQKRGYAFTFGMPFELAMQVSQFIRIDDGLDGAIEGPRQQLLKKLGVGEEIAKGRVFLSATTGQPLSDHAVSEIFADAFKVIGAPKGAGGHALRRFSAQEEADDEIAYRRANGLSLASEDVALAVQEKLGQASQLSQRAYRRALTKIRSDSHLEKLRAQLLEQQGKTNLVRTELAVALRRIEELQSQIKVRSRARPRKDSGRRNVVPKRR